MDFVIPTVREGRNGPESVYPIFERINKDAASRGGKLFAYWNGEAWNSVERSDTQLMSDINTQVIEYRNKNFANNAHVGWTSVSSDPNTSKEFERFYRNYKGNSKFKFNTRVFFKSDKPVREDLSTFQLSYDPIPGDTPAFDKAMHKWYKPEDKEIVLWFIGAALTNNMKPIQKFLFIYGSGGSGKGSLLSVIEQVFEDYSKSIKLKKLAGASQFANSEIEDIPVLVDEETDLSRMENQENFLSLTAHEELWIEKKGKDPYPETFNGLLVTASNKPYDMGNSKSGLGRRMVAIYPLGGKFEIKEYDELMNHMSFEIPYIADQAIQTFQQYGLGYLDNMNEDWRMRLETDDIFNFIRESVRHGVLKQDTTLKIASEAYRAHLESNDWSIKGSKNRIKNELKQYYNEYYEEKRVDNVKRFNLYIGLKMDRVFPEKYQGDTRVQEQEKRASDSEYISDYNIFADSDAPAQYSGLNGAPTQKWAKVTTKVKELDQSKEHWLQLPVNRIRMDFDKGTLEENIEAAKAYPPTYGEISKSGKGIHLHYIYDGDVTELDGAKHDDVEVKVSMGNASVRRKFTYSNGLELSHISSGLPLKEKKVLTDTKEYIATENSIRKEITRALKKEHHGATKPEIDFIFKILNDAKNDGIQYDLRDMRQAVMNFALNSSHQSEGALKVYAKMPFSTIMDLIDTPQADISDGSELFNSQQAGHKVFKDEDLYFYDIEVFKNLLMVSWKKYGEEEISTWYNPSQAEIEWLLDKPLVGFNNRKYDNHIMYAALIGKTPEELYESSKAIIGGSKNAFYAQAYSLAYADIYDYSNTKQSLKKWEVDLGLPHDELEFDWDAPLPKEDWARAAEYNRHDVDATEDVFKHLYADYEARISLSGLTDSPVSESTNSLSAKFLFGNERRPQDKFIYTDLSERFPGYKYGYLETEVKHKDGSVTKKKTMHSEYRGEDPSEGGYVYSQPGVYEDTIEFDVRSMHPNSLINLNYFGPYTQRYAELVDARAHIKHAHNKDGSLNHESINKAKEMLNGELAPYLTDDADFAGLAYALKIVVNSVYGMTSASFENKFKHPKNVDNIIAKRGALFMIDLKHKVTEFGYKVIHIKTDSIKVANADDKVAKFITDTAAEYGYDIEVAGEYDRMALINKAVLIAHNKGGDEKDWHAVGKEFAVPYVYKTLFTHDELVDEDYIISKSAKAGPIFLGDKFIGKVGTFYASRSGQELAWIKDDKRNALTGTKGFFWRLPEDLTNKYDIDQNYYDTLVVDALKKINKVGDISKLIEVPKTFKSLLEAS